MHRFVLMVAVVALVGGTGGRVVVAERPQGNQAPAPAPAPVYDVRVELNQVTTGTTTFMVDASGKVTGTMHLDNPNVVDATLSGTVKDGVWTFEYTFSMSAQNCTGTSAGTAKVSADRATVTGTLTASGGCVPDPQTGTFTFTKRVK